MAQNRRGKCPMCSNERGNLPENKWYPFCGEKCKILDLYNWLSEEYFVPCEQLPQAVSDEEE